MTPEIRNSSLLYSSQPTGNTSNSTSKHPLNPSVLLRLPHQGIISCLYSCTCTPVGLPDYRSLPPPQYIPCTEARMNFLNHGTNPECQYSGVSQNVDSRAWVESCFHRLRAVSVWECYSTCLCFTLLQS